jgi:lipoyl(octanoyl) transferase
MHIGFGAARPAQIRRLGTVLYGAGLQMQTALAERVGRGGPDQILLLEHNPVFTMGRNASKADIHVSDDFLERNGVGVHWIDRGGQVTYHGPGQIVAYPICNLRGGRQSVAWLVRGLEQAMIGTAADFGISAKRLAGSPGVWVETERGPEKLGAIGLHLKKWISTHGLAFNVAPDMERFRWITPCGIADKGACSLRTLLGDACPSWGDACASLGRRIHEALALEPLPAPEPSQSVSVTAWRRGAGGAEVLIVLRQTRQAMQTMQVMQEGRWQSSVAGMVEPGETLEDAAIRAAKEGAGLTGKLAGPLFSHTLLDLGPNGDPLFSTETCFHMEVPLDQDAPLAAPNGAPHGERRWIPPKEAMSLAAHEDDREGDREALRLLAPICGWTTPNGH